ncbi:MAG: hypothetical protein LAO56_16180 [Acidobacteriia bacterium]|nr:hypothetical protein [Terriglobia bacterium]
MGSSSPRRSSLYRNTLAAVTLLGCTWGAWTWIFAQGTIAQYGRRAPASKGPRAIGLVLLSPKGKVRLTPIAIMVDGKFYDAGSYKGKPVPMALDFGVVYEGFRTGVSQGIFTITQPGQLNHNWIAEGTWLPAGAKPPETSKKYETPVIEDTDAPPKLHRGSDKPATPAPPAPRVPSVPASPPAPPVAKAPPEPQSIDDPNRPLLRRGKPDPNARREAMKTFEEDEFATKGKAATTTAEPAIQFIPAISDAGGPDPRPYTYELKPQEEASYRAKMLDLAASELRAKAKTEAPASAAAKHRVPAAAKPSKPAFDDVRLRIFDLSNSNEPVLVLSAKTRVSGDVLEPEEITLVARTSLEGELRRLFFSETNSRHLDVEPRMELIDAVDADGDGRGELLFRRTSDTGSAYSIYRVTADQLWPLYEGTP